MFLAKNCNVKSRNAAKTMIENGVVWIDGMYIAKPSYEIDESEGHNIKIITQDKFVSRGGIKLEAGLDAFGIDVTDYETIDIGASTGGFTDCLLQHGAKHVVALDSGINQLDRKLADDNRVLNIEKYNARNLSPDIIPNKVDIAVMDVSFISQTLIIPKIPDVLKPNGVFISLIKPQYEAGRAAVGKGGIVKQGKDRLFAILRVRDAAFACGLIMTNIIISPIKGGDGNIEYLALFERVGTLIEEKALHSYAYI